MKDSPLFGTIFPAIWIVTCIAIMIGFLAAWTHFLQGLCPFVFGPSHRWELKSDWGACLIRASAWTVIFIAYSIWRTRRKTTHQKLDSI